MKKHLVISMTLLAMLTLAGCGNNSKKNQSDSSSIASEKKALSSSKKAFSEKQARLKAESKASSYSSQISSSNAAAAASSNSVAATSTQASASTDSEPTTLTDFLNKYGVSPALYKMDHDGMTQDEALAATPDDMETSGELQTEHSPQ